jgi:elongation factor Ts
MTEITAKMIKDLRERTGIGMGKCKEALEEAKGDIELAIDNLRKAGMAQAVKKEGRETNEGLIKSASNDKALALIEINAETDFVVRNERFQEFADTLAKEVLRIMPSTLKEFIVAKYAGDPNMTIDEYRSVIVQTLGENVQLRRLELFPKKTNRSLGVYSHGAGKLVCLVEIEGSDQEEGLAKDIAMHIAAESPEYLNSEEVPERVKEHEREIARAQVEGKPAAIIDKIIEGKLKAYYDQTCLLNQNYVKDPSIKISEFVEREGKKKGKKLSIVQFVRWHVGG